MELNTLAVDAGMMALLPVSRTDGNDCPHYTQQIRLNGDYQAWAVTEGLPGWGLRVKKLVISRPLSPEDLGELIDLTETESIESIGQLRGDGDPWIFADPSYVCDEWIVNSATQYPVRQNWKGGVVVSSGIGDGAYTLDADFLEDETFEFGVVTFFSDTIHMSAEEIVMELSRHLADDSNYEGYWMHLLTRLLELTTGNTADRQNLLDLQELVHKPFHPSQENNWRVQRLQEISAKLDKALEIPKSERIPYRSFESSNPDGTTVSHRYFESKSDKLEAEKIFAETAIKAQTTHMLRQAELTPAEHLALLELLSEVNPDGVLLPENADPDYDLVRECHPELLERWQQPPPSERIETLDSALRKLLKTTDQ